MQQDAPIREAGLAMARAGLELVPVVDQAGALTGVMTERALAREFLAAGQPRQARAYLSAETAGDDAELLLALATLEFADGREDEARTAMGRMLALAPDREADIVRLADELIAKGRIESAFACVDAITDAVLLQGEVQRAVDVLQKFIEQASHPPAIAKLAGVAEDLVRGDPASDAYADLLLQALTRQGTANPDKAVARVRAGQSLEAAADDALSMDDLDLGAAGPEAAASDAMPEVDIFVYPEKDTPSVPDLPAADMPIEPPAVEHFWARTGEFRPDQEELLKAVDRLRGRLKRPPRLTELLALLRGLGYRQLTPEMVAAYDAGRLAIAAPCAAEEPAPAGPPG